MIEILRNFRRRKLRSALTISGIVIGILALTTMGALAEHFNALLDGGVRYYGSVVQVGDETGSNGLLPLSKRQELHAVSGVAYVEPLVEVQAKPGSVAAVSLGVPDFISSRDPSAARYAQLRLTIAAGHDLGGSGGEVVLGSAFAKEFGKKVGDSIDLPVRPSDAKSDFVNHSFTVAGILSVTQTAPDNGAYVSLADAQMLLADQLPLALRGKVDTSQVVNAFAVYPSNVADGDAVADRINSQVAGVKAIKPSVLVNAFKAGGATFTAITTVAALLALIIGGISVINTMLMAVTERIREIGLKKAVGARTSRILREFLAEATAIGLVGGAVGFAIGYGLTVLLNLSNNIFLVTGRLTLICLVFATALGALAGIVPALRASRLDPVTALRTSG